MFSLGEDAHANCVDRAALEAFIDGKFAVMFKAPLMFGSPESVEMECLLLIEVYERFCRAGGSRDVSPSGPLFQAFARKHHPSRPGPLLLCDWLARSKPARADDEVGRPDEHVIANRVVQFYSAWKTDLRR